MHYDPQAPIDTVFDQVEDLLEYGELARSLYNQIHTTNISYTIINSTRKLQDAIKTWNRMNPIEQNWINSKTLFGTSHRNLEETDKLTMEAVGYHQYIQVNDIVAHMSGLPFPYPPQDSECTPTPNPDPTIVPTVQPTPVANFATYLYNILPQILTNMQHMQQLLIQIQKNQTRGGVQTSNRNTRTCQAATEPRQRKPHKPLPEFSK